MIWWLESCEASHVPAIVVLRPGHASEHINQLRFGLLHVALQLFCRHAASTASVMSAAAPQVVLPDRLSEEVRRLLDWHWSQLEYGCSAPLSKVGVFPAAALLAI